MRDQDLKNYLQDLLDVLFGLPEAEVESLPNEAEVLVEALVLEYLLGVDGAILNLQFIEDPVEDLHEGLGLPGLGLFCIHNVNFFLLEEGVVGDSLLLLDGIVGVALDVEVVEEADDGGLCLLEGLVEEKVGENVG